MARNRADGVNLLLCRNKTAVLFREDISPKGAVMIIPFLIWSILIILPALLIAWRGVRDDEDNGRS
ncbi:MAG TPA: hypothetical protein EYP41_10235 [Anaerolineae bacterium]|nr:hypothetical protein [Anaerolineae bacterium]